MLIATVIALDTCTRHLQADRTVLAIWVLDESYVGFLILPIRRSEPAKCLESSLNWPKFVVCVIVVNVESRKLAPSYLPQVDRSKSKCLPVILALLLSQNGGMPLAGKDIDNLESQRSAIELHHFSEEA